MARLLRWELSRMVEMIVLTLLNKFDAMIMIEGNRGCLTKDTVIKTPTGNKKISNIKDGDKLLSYDFKNNKEIPMMSKKIDSGIKEVYEITTNDGKKIKATLDHIFFVKWGANIGRIPILKSSFLNIHIIRVFI